MLFAGIRSQFAATAHLLFAIAATILLASSSLAGTGTPTASGTQMGVTSQYLGANEGSSQFNINDLVDLGINSYRIYGGMSRWEPTNAESTYGSPTIAQIEANPAVMNWAFYDNIFTNPPGGSDYSWSAGTGIPPVSAATIISNLNAHNITPIVVLRNVDNNGNPSWAPNPPVTTNDWNVWFEFVFATVYWFNVRNNYVVDNWEVHNEPNNSGMWETLAEGKGTAYATRNHVPLHDGCAWVGPFQCTTSGFSISPSLRHELIHLVDAGTTMRLKPASRIVRRPNHSNSERSR